MPQDKSQHMFEVLKENYKKEQRADLFEAIEVSDRLQKLGEDVPASKKFAEDYNGEIVRPLVLSLLTTAFDVKRYPDGINNMMDLAAERPYISGSAEYASVNYFKAIVTAGKTGNCGAMLQNAEKIAGHTVRLGVLTQLKKAFSGFELTDEVYLTFEAVANYLKTDQFSIGNAVPLLKDRILKQVRLDDDSKKPEELTADADEKVLVCLIAVVSGLYKSEISDELKNSLVDSGCDLERQLNVYIQKYLKKR